MKKEKMASEQNGKEKAVVNATDTHCFVSAKKTPA